MRQKNQKYNYLGARLRGKRIEQGLTLDELADMTDLQVTYLEEIERGQLTIQYNTFVTIAMALGSTSHELLSPSARSLERLVRIADFRRIK